MTEPVIVVVPIYKAELDEFERFSLAHSLAVLENRPVRFVGPEGLDTRFYAATWPDIPFLAFAPEYFASIPGYNRLLLSHAFHAPFGAWEFMLLLQTDAIILRDELDYWCSQPFDYVGAPWPTQYELFVELDRFVGGRGKHMKVSVGNGGLSLRRIAKCRALLDEFPDATRVFEHTGSSEDLFYAVMGALSNDFVIPNEITASRFSMELQPSYYYAVNGGHLPMGGHAWWKYEPQFWRPHLPGMPG
jgi:hypothetical protein